MFYTIFLIFDIKKKLCPSDGTLYMARRVEDNNHLGIQKTVSLDFEKEYRGAATQGWLIDCFVCYAVSALFQPCNLNFKNRFKDVLHATYVIMLCKRWTNNKHQCFNTPKL